MLQLRKAIDMYMAAEGGLWCPPAGIGKEIDDRLVR